ncbi:phytanoyl-CoA dioxygenase family protein [Paenibacillus sp. CF384]|uniref:phytanoyl-CoA dioxygenase family protein n=1 Tax=Paenibacillus sp. CF384 TaxID=1884382 RepID=UPI000895E9B7|nr:phytanoyl-CoA dioxygenase family protein [Paenibacillus sp. CF384]SDW90891.1 Phytanoyl-CoA dioxygenase (PhyH) [Paenibacillus sp. CF384]
MYDTTALQQEKIAFYRQNGFVQLDGVISEEELRELRLCADEAMHVEVSQSTQPDKTNRGYYRVLNQRFNTWRDHGGMSRFSLSRRLGDMARQLTGADGIRVFHDHLLYKMPGDSKPTPWHQDLPYWPMKERGALSIWLPLDDVDERNGCMMFVPGSHQVGKLNAVDLVNPQDLYAFEESESVRNTRPVVVPMKAGSCTFHDGLTFHYAHANLTDKPRRVLAIIFMPDGTIYTGQPHILCDLDPSLVAGAPIAGPLYPKLV